MKSVAKDLTKEIAEKSIYDYLENTLGVSIVTSKRIMTVEKMTEIDEKYLDLGDYNCMAVVTSHTYNSDGVMFEYTSHAIALITLASRIMQQDNQFSKGKKYETEKYFIYRHGWNNIVL